MKSAGKCRALTPTEGERRVVALCGGPSLSTGAVSNPGSMLRYRRQEGTNAQLAGGAVDLGALPARPDGHCWVATSPPMALTVALVPGGPDAPFPPRGLWYLAGHTAESTG